MIEVQMEKTEPKPLLKVSQLEQFKAYVHQGSEDADGAYPYVIFGVDSDAAISRNDRESEATVYGIDNEGTVWDSTDTSARFVEVHVTITVRAKS